MFGEQEKNSMTRIIQKYNSSSECFYYIPASIKTVKITNCETISFGAFHNCVMISSVSLPDSLEILDDYSFCECRGFNNVIIPKEVKTIGNYAFGGNFSSTDFSVEFNGEKLENIGEYAFVNKGGLQDIKIPANVLGSIGNNAFQG